MIKKLLCALSAALLLASSATAAAWADFSSIWPVASSLLRAKDSDLDRMRTSLIRRQATRATSPITEADVAYLVEETNSNTEFVKKVLKDLGY